MQGVEAEVAVLLVENTEETCKRRVCVRRAERGEKRKRGE
jgi:hypothetical protein